MKRLRPPHKPGDCEAVCSDGKLCNLWAMYKMTRIDNTSIVYCTRHRSALDAHRALHREAYNPVTWSTVK